MKILIENTVPFNNGDAALIFSIGQQFESKGAEVHYSVPNLKEIKNIYPEKNWVKSFLPIKFLKIPFIGYIFLCLLIVTSKKHREYDAIVSAPGGYINSYYSFKRRLQILFLYKFLLKKKIYMYSQSIGPFTEKDAKILKKFIKHFTLFYVRDDVSKDRVDNIGTFNNVIQTKDAAFLLNPIWSEKKSFKKVAISVREWKFDNRSENIYNKLIENIVDFFVSKGYKVVFLSTCQGEPSYRDDSQVAKNIYLNLQDHIKNHVSVDDNYYKLNDLRHKLKEFDYVIGTRLHMCILSWLSGTPALNISYEEKGKESYKYLNIPEYSIDYNHDGEINKTLEMFIEKENFFDVFENIKNINKESKNYFDTLFKTIN